MAYLLMHALIFMPIKHKGHQQVTGPPANSKFLGFPTARPDTMPSIYSSRWSYVLPAFLSYIIMLLDY